MSGFFNAIAAFIGNISPKVRAGLNWGVLATLAVALLNAITPQMLSWAGPFEPVLFSVIPILTGQIAAWIKTDPVRVAGQAALAAKVVVPQSTPAPGDTPTPIQKEG